MSEADEAQALFDSGFKDQNEKRFEEALVKYRAAAKMGRGRAMNAVGVAFLNGQGVAKNVVKAYKWFKTSAETDEPRALRNLAVAYRNGVPEAGINVNHVKAMRLMRMSADVGWSKAMYDLADWLREANENDPAALEWFMKRAVAGNADCMMIVGELHRIGTCGLKQDYSKALPWFERAAAKGDADQIVRIANALQESGDLVRAVELYEKASGSGSTAAMFNLALCYANGKGVAKSAEKAAELYQRASDLGDAMAMSNLGVCYERGDGVAKSAEKAVELYQRASDRGDAKAMSRLGVCYANGRGVVTNFEKAFALFSRASELGDATATANLGVCYMNGNGVAASIRIGAEFWLRAAAMGESNVKQLIDSGMLEWREETCYCVVTGLLSGGAPDSTTARKLLETRQTRRRISLGAFVFDGDNFPIDLIGETLRLFAEFDRLIQSLQFALRLNKERPPACSAEQQRWFDRVAKLMGGAVIDDGDVTVLTEVALLVSLGNEMPLELYEALKPVVDASVAKLTVKSVLPLVCVLEELDRVVRSLELSDKARFVVRACVFGAMCEHLLAAELPNDLTSETAIETTLLWLGVVRQAEFFGGVEVERVAMVERTVEARLSNDKSVRDKYAMILVRDLKRRVPHLLLATPEFAAASAAKLDGEIENKRVKVILLGDSGVGKTQIRRRLGGVHAFDAKHTSTDTAEVTSIEVTRVSVATTRWIERDDMKTSESVKLHGPAVARSLMFAATGADNVSHTSSILSGARELEHASSSSSGDARGVAPMKSVSLAETRSDAATVGVSETITPAMHADLSTSSASAPAATSLSSFVPQELNFSVMDERMVLSLWDFGGQVEYFAVHDLFLTSGAVYVLVVDWTKGVDKARESAQMWMNAIRAHVGDDALVLPVLPRCSKQSDDDNAVDEVAREVEKLVGCMPVRVDSATDRNYTELKRELLKLSEDCVAMVPMRWLQVHDELCRLRADEKKQWMTRDEFRTLLQSLHGTDAAAVSNDAVEDALTFLKQSGTVLTCGGGGRVSEYVFLDPELFLRLVRPLINTHEQITKRQAAARNDAGVAAAQRNLRHDFERMNTECIASRALLEHLWRGVQSPTDDIGFFVELLEHCGLMCELERGAFFVPAASKATPSGGLNLDWISSGEQIAFVCESVTAVPPSLLPRIVASLFKSGAIDKLSRQRIVTQSDVVLLLRKSGGADLRRMRLQQKGVAFVITLQRSHGDHEAAVRAWRVCAYVALYCAIESVLRQVFRSLKVHASVWCSGCSDWHTGDICPSFDIDLASIDAWLPCKDDEFFAQRQNWRVISVTNETLDAFLERPTLDALLKWCGEHCKSVRTGVATCFPLELRELDAFWAAVRQVADVYRGRTTFDAAVFYPGREDGGKVLLENHLADLIRQELVKMGNTVYYADRDRNGRFDENIVAAVVGCRRAVFVVSRLWFERKWCLAEMLLAMATGDDSKCKVIQFGDDFRAELVPLHQRVLRERFDAKKLISDEATRLARWLSSVVQSPIGIAQIDDDDDVDKDDLC
jgi:TPR repeat protein/GTPase SAR1 family protein